MIRINIARVLGHSSLAAMAAALLVAATAKAEEPRELRYALAVDLPVTSVAAAFLVTTQVFQSSLAPTSCRWCGTAADGSDTVNGLD